MSLSQDALPRLLPHAAGYLGTVSQLVVQLGIALLIVALIIAGIIFWLIVHRWGPAMQRLLKTVDQEIHAASSSADIVQQQARQQMKRGRQQEEALKVAAAGLRSLHQMTANLHERAREMQNVALQMIEESDMRGTADPTLAHHLVASAEQLALTVEEVQHTYHSLQRSIHQVSSTHEADQQLMEQAEHHARELTGALQRVRYAVQEQRPSGGERRGRRGSPARVNPLDDPPPQGKRRPTHPPEQSRRPSHEVDELPRNGSRQPSHPPNGRPRSNQFREPPAEHRRDAPHGPPRPEHNPDFAAPWDESIPQYRERKFYDDELDASWDEPPRPAAPPSRRGSGRERPPEGRGRRESNEWMR